MIDYISIKNFRCFEETQIGGFGNVNLIGGLNNSGKTALLEALLLCTFPTTNSFEEIRKLRNEGFERDSNLNPWSYLFHNQNDNKNIEILTKDKEQKEIANVDISSTKNVELLLQKNKFLNEERLGRIVIDDANLFLLNVIGNNQGEEFGYLPILREQRPLNTVYFNKIGQTPKSFDTITNQFFQASLKKNDAKLAKLYTLAGNKITYFNNFMQKLDSRIISSKITAPNEIPIIELELDNHKSFPIKMFGDAIQKTAEIILLLLNTSNSILLIDEIENGLHYTKQKSFWEALFKIAEDQKVQIFATTHSHEMIMAFAKVAKKQETMVGVYFQMYKSGLSKQIVAAPYTNEELLFALKQNIPLRGETEEYETLFNS
jgi:AAA15 family ATPase/GTPase